jgi:O-antigen ligase
LKLFEKINKLFSLNHKYSLPTFGVLFLASLICATLLQQPIILLLPFLALSILYALYNLVVVWYLLIALLPISFEYQLTEFLGLDVPDELLMMFLSFIFFILLIVKKINIPKVFLNNTISGVIFLALYWSVVSAFFSSQPILSFKYVLAKLWFLVPFVILPWLLLKNTKLVITTAVCLIVPMTLIVIIALVKHAKLGFLFDNINEAVQPFFRNHVNYGAMLVCLIVPVWAIYKHCSHIQTKRVLLGILFIYSLALFFSYSRGAWLALVVGIVAMWLIKMRALAYAFILSLVVVVVSLLWLTKENRYLNYHHNYKKTIYHADFKDHMSATFAGTDMSNAERFNRWVAGIRMSKNNTLTGFGPNTFYHNYKPYIVSYFKTWVSDNKEKSTVHNYFLLLLVEQGWPGLLLFISLLFFAFKKVEQLHKKISNAIDKTIVMCLGIMLSMIVTLNMLSDLIETDKIGSIFYLCLGLLIWMEIKYKKTITT